METTTDVRPRTRTSRGDNKPSLNARPRLESKAATAAGTGPSSGSTTAKKPPAKTKLINTRRTDKASNGAVRTSKQDQLADLLVRDEGATIAQMTETTGWLPHTVRAALTGLRKKGYAIDSDRADGVRTYRGVAPE